MAYRISDMPEAKKADADASAFLLPHKKLKLKLIVLQCHQNDMLLSFC